MQVIGKVILQAGMQFLFIDKNMCKTGKINVRKEQSTKRLPPECTGVIQVLPLSPNKTYTIFPRTSEGKIGH